MCVRCGTGRIAWCTDPYRHGESTEPVSPGDPPAVADLTARVAELAARIEVNLAADEVAAGPCELRHPGPWETADSTDSPLPGAVTLYDSRDDSVAVIRGSYTADHIARNDPARALRRVRATRDLTAAILAERHDYNESDGYYSCSQAADPDPCPGESGEPGSGCSDPDRAGNPCDCGRDARVARLLGIIASEWGE